MKIIPPSSCPSCGNPTSFINDQLFCTNEDCEARVAKKAIKFCKVFGIKGLGEKQIEKFEFDCLFDVCSTLLTVSATELSEIMGSSALAEKVHPQLDIIKQPVDTATLIEALSIPSIGTVQAKKLAPFFPYDVKKASLGEVATSKVQRWLEDNLDILGLFILKAPKAEPLNLVPVAITGKLSNKMTKAKATEELRNFGFDVKSSLTKEVKFLICDTDQTSSSCEKARKYNIQIITYKSLIEGNIKHD